MEKGAKYVVNTHWGQYRLDEGAYRDYLAGRLWICWAPGKHTAVPPAREALTVSSQALELRNQAAMFGVLSALQGLGLQRAAVPFLNRLADMPIDELNLSVRSSNGLKRANVHTLGQLRELMGSDTGLPGVRNLGVKSVKEIKTRFLSVCYEALTAEEKALYWQQMLEDMQE